MYVYEFYNGDDFVYYASKLAVIAEARGLQKYLLEQHGPHETGLHVDKITIPSPVLRPVVVALLNRTAFCEDRETIWSPELDASF